MANPKPGILRGSQIRQMCGSHLQQPFCSEGSPPLSVCCLCQRGSVFLRFVLKEMCGDFLVDIVNWQRLFTNGTYSTGSVLYITLLYVIKLFLQVCMNQSTKFNTKHLFYFTMNWSYVVPINFGLPTALEVVICMQKKAKKSKGIKVQFQEGHWFISILILFQCYPR